MFLKITTRALFIGGFLAVTPLQQVFADNGGAIPLLQSISQHILNPLIILMFAVAMAYFFFGILRFVAGMGSDEAREKGKKHMMWGIVGLFIMIGVYGIIRIILNSLGIGTEHIFFF